MAKLLTHEEVKTLRENWNDLFENRDNLRSLSGKRWKVITREFLQNRESITETPITANIHKELSDLKRILSTLEETIVSFSKDIAELRNKNTDIVSGMIEELFSCGKYSAQALQLAKEDFYAHTATNYSIIFETDRPIGECIESMSSWDISQLLQEVEADIVRLADDYTRKLSANI